MRTLNADTLGADGIWVDPLWRIRVELTPLESELLRTWWVRRLAFVAHAGAASITTTQTYSRLEHSLGVLALVAHFAPEDHEARAAALLHDVGHLPFSHTLEGIAGLDHHRLGAQRIGELGPVLERHGTSAERVIALDMGSSASPLHASSGAMKLDHLDSFVRSGQAHGRSVTAASELLSRCRLRDGGVDTDPATADELVRLVVAEARAQRAAPNVVPIAVLRDLVTRALASADAAFGIEELTTMTDGDLWSALLTCEATRERTMLLRRDPAAWRLSEVPDREDGEALTHSIVRGYLSLPTVDGAPIDDPEIDELHEALPVHHRVTLRADVSRRAPKRPPGRGRASSAR